MDFEVTEGYVAGMQESLDKGNKYSQVLDYNMTSMAIKTEQMIADCNTLRSYLYNGVSGISWYFYSNEARKIFDTISLVEHDLVLLIHQIDNVRETNYRLYNPEEGI